MSGPHPIDRRHVGELRVDYATAHIPLHRRVARLRVLIGLALPHRSYLLQGLYEQMKIDREP